MGTGHEPCTRKKNSRAQRNRVSVPFLFCIPFLSWGRKRIWENYGISQVQKITSQLVFGFSKVKELPLNKKCIARWQTPSRISAQFPLCLAIYPSPNLPPGSELLWPIVQEQDDNTANWDGFAPYIPFKLHHTGTCGNLNWLVMHFLLLCPGQKHFCIEAPWKPV